MKTTSITFILALFMCIWTACGSSEQADSSTPEQESSSVNTADDQDDGNVNDLAGAMKEASKALEQLSAKNEDGEKVEVVNFRELKKLMPESLAGMDRENAGGETAGALGFKVSTAEATYKDGDKRLEVKINDAGGVPQFAMGAASWANIEIDKEDDNGFERTTTINGHKAFMSYKKNTGRSKIALLVANRFVVELEGRNIEPDQLEEMLEELDLDQIAELAS